MFWNPRKAERRPWEMFFVGLLYGSLSLLIVRWIFSQDPVLSKYSGLMIVLFAVMFTMPFMYFAGVTSNAGFFAAEPGEAIWNFSVFLSL